MGEALTQTLPLQVPCGNASTLQLYESSSQWITAFVCNATEWTGLLQHYAPSLSVIPTPLLCC